MVIDLLRVGNEKESFDKLISFLKNPSLFYSKNKDDENKILDYFVFITRISIVIRFLVDILFYGKHIEIGIIYFIALIFAPLIAMISLMIISFIVNLFVKKFSGKDDVLLVKRVIVFAGIAMIFNYIPYVSLITPFIFIYLASVGIKKQYKLSTGKSVASVAIPTLLIFFFPLIASSFLKVQEWSYERATPDCIDTDGGHNIYVKGETGSEEWMREDSCVEDHSLREYSCEEKTVIITHTSCPNSCRDGACIK